MRFSKKGFLFSREYTRKHNFKMTIYYSENMCLNFKILKKISLFKRKLKRQFRDDNLLFWKNIHIHICVYINFETVKKMFLFYFRWLCNTIPVEISMRVILYYIIQKSSQEMTIRTEAQSVREIGNNLCLPACVCVRARTRKRNGDRDDHRCKLRYRAV